MSKESSHLERLDELRDDAIDVLEHCMDDREAKWKDRISAAREVLDRTATHREPKMGRDEISERLGLALRGLVGAFFPGQEINVTPTVEEILEGHKDGEKENGSDGEIYEGSVEIKAIEEKKKYG